MGKDGSRIGRKDAQGMDELINLYIREMRLASGFNCRRVFDAWDFVSGASRHTVDRFFRDGVLYCTIGSSVVRNQLYFQRDVLVRKMNEYLDEDPMVIRTGDDEPLVRTLVLK